MEVKLYNQDGSEVGTVSLNDAIFGVRPNPHVLHQYVVNYLANQRQGTSSAKGRSEVSGGGTKPWRQKGTGRARAGTIRSPLWRGGGIIFGPEPRSYYSKFPKRMKRLALLSALSTKAQEQHLVVVDKIELGEIKTKKLAGVIGKLGLEEKKCLILHEGQSPHLEMSSRNMPRVNYSRAPLVNAYDVMNADVLVFTKAGLDKVQEVFAS
ncbi:50S ribosomal protein L4 [Candidatus Zixiibacteriota bacterium]|nr:50S ribosomal protein L4 [candidate division Zixibacteria bacterium]